MNSASRRGRLGFSLVEMLVLLVIVGILMAMGWPKLQRALNKVQLRSARTAVVTSYARARAAAIERSQTVTLTLANNQVLVTGPRRGSPGVLDTIGTVQDIYVGYQASLSASPATQTTFDSRGLGANSAVTVTLMRQGVTDSVRLGPFGRVTIP